ncbi:hypothetical protein [Schaalia sp. ZJ1691]|uniref:hypothetical protein n=1 Tax=Schaalia sp. ZJ1691 TaxID=2709404 RepID=UPI001F14D419|nr:hypothetical protein [Schaalia sp. ZJ1691]
MDRDNRMANDREPGLPSTAQGVEDTRPPALGLGRIVIAMYWLFGLWVTVVAVLDLLRPHRSVAATSPLGIRVVSLLAGIVYLLAAVAITHNGRRMRILGWISCGIALVGSFIVSLASLGVPELSAVRSAWTTFGSDFAYLPIVISVIGLVWMWYSNPRRIVEIAEQVDSVNTHRVKRR